MGPYLANSSFAKFLITSDAEHSETIRKVLQPLQVDCLVVLKDDSGEVAGEQ